MWNTTDFRDGALVEITLRELRSEAEQRRLVREARGRRGTTLGSIARRITAKLSDRKAA